MNTKPAQVFSSHGDGRFKPSQFRKIGQNVIFEPGVLVFHPENIEIGNNVYFGHNTIIKGYHQNRFTIDSNTWIGQNCFLHAAGGLFIGESVGIGPMVTIITSQHLADRIDRPIITTGLKFAPVTIGDGADIGCGSIILPGVKIGKGAIIGAGAVVTGDIPNLETWAGVPARKLKKRG
ncbi:MAG: acyltransferase [Candidatus Omnitrophica bacterium]|nr:acyltransferase [Candidatus Omnitrophota bacterium]